MKRFLSLGLVCFLVWWGICPCGADEIGTSAEAAVLMDSQSGEILYEKNGDRRMLIASTTKIMTALVAMECAAPDETVEVCAEHMTEGSSMYLEPGETVTVEDLLYGLMLCSGNDAAMCLADHCGGMERFVERMNEKAAAIGMENTSFENPSGLDGEAHYSTARDMALLAAAAMKEPTMRRICATKTVQIGGRTMTNHNKLLSCLDGCVGLKTGYTRAAGRTLVSCCERNGRSLVAITLRDGDDWTDHMALYEWAFREENG